MGIFSFTTISLHLFFPAVLPHYHPNLTKEKNLRSDCKICLVFFDCNQYVKIMTRMSGASKGSSILT